MFQCFSVSLKQNACVGFVRGFCAGPNPLKSKNCLHIHDRVWLMFSLVRVGKEWADPVFLHPDNHLHKVDAFTFQGGERRGWPNFSPPQ